MKLCPHCLEIQYNHLIVNHHTNGCPNKINLKKASIGNCSTCGTELNDCIWAYWLDGLFCRECAEKSDKEK